MLKADITKEQSIQENLNTWCYEVGTKFEDVNKQAANEFLSLVPDAWCVYDLGCGDGASAKVLDAARVIVVAVDINTDKLIKIPSRISTVQEDILTLLKSHKDNCLNAEIYMHHSLEHCVDAQEILQEIGRVLVPGRYFYCIVPAEDSLHSVHHVAFESPEELIPPGMKPIICTRQIRNEPEFKVIARKYE